VTGWLVGAYAVIMLLLIAVSGAIALFERKDALRREDAYRVLKLLVLAGAASGGILGLLVKLHELGLLR
jgi:hypothetical protein